MLKLVFTVLIFFFFNIIIGIIIIDVVDDDDGVFPLHLGWVAADDDE